MCRRTLRFEPSASGLRRDLCDLDSVRLRGQSVRLPPALLMRHLATAVRSVQHVSAQCLQVVADHGVDRRGVRIARRASDDGLAASRAPTMPAHVPTVGVARALHRRCPAAETASPARGCAGTIARRAMKRLSHGWPRAARVAHLGSHCRRPSCAARPLKERKTPKALPIRRRARWESLGDLAEGSPSPNQAGNRPSHLPNVDSAFEPLAFTKAREHTRIGRSTPATRRTSASRGGKGRQSCRTKTVRRPIPVRFAIQQPQKLSRSDRAPA